MNASDRMKLSRWTILGLAMLFVVAFLVGNSQEPSPVWLFAGFATTFIGGMDFQRAKDREKMDSGTEAKR